MTCDTLSSKYNDRDEIIRMLEELAPPELAESFDSGRIGLIIEGKKEISTICTCLDVTSSVVRLAVQHHCDFLIAHHTPIWTPLTSISGNDAQLFSIILSSGLNIYVMHTNWDHAPGGVNDILAQILGLTDTVPMSFGLVGSCSKNTEEIARDLSAPLRVWGEISGLKRLAILAGSGFDSEIIEEAKRLGADAFLSAELRHSVYRASPLPLLESTHYALESPSMRVLAEKYGWDFIDDPPVMSISS